MLHAVSRNQLLCGSERTAERKCFRGESPVLAIVFISTTKLILSKPSHWRTYIHFSAISTTISIEIYTLLQTLEGCAESGNTAFRVRYPNDRNTFFRHMLTFHFNFSLAKQSENSTATPLRTGSIGIHRKINEARTTLTLISVGLFNPICVAVIGYETAQAKEDSEQQKRVEKREGNAEGSYGGNQILTHCATPLIPRAINPVTCKFMPVIRHDSTGKHMRPALIIKPIELDVGCKMSRSYISITFRLWKEISDRFYRHPRVDHPCDHSRT